MDKLPMCRICLVENVNMYVVVNKNLYELYEKLTDIPFVTKDRRPIHACFFCCAKLKQCFRFRRKCLEAEELFTQMMNDDYEPNPSISQDDSHCCTGFIKSPIVHVSIVDKCGTESIAIKKELPDICQRQDDVIKSPIVHISVFDECETDSIVIKEEVPAICEGQDDVIDPKEEYLSDDLDLENLNNTCLGIKDIPPHLSQSDSGGDVKIEVEDQELSKKNQRAVGTNNKCEADSIAIKEEVPAICERQDDVIEPKEEYLSDLELEHLNNTCLGIEDIPPHLSQSDSSGDVKIKVEEEQELSKKKRRAVETSREPVTKNPKLDTRRTRLEDTNTVVGLKKNEHSNLEVIRTSKSHTSKHGPSVKESSKCDQRRQRADIKKHCRKHTADKPYKCDVCQRSFSKKFNLTAHVLIHTGEKPFKCDLCPRSYSKKTNLTKHIRIHTGENPYQCDVCQRSFSMKSHLTAHNRIHTGENRYKCDLCQLSFSVKSSLTKHIRIHTGEKPYKCEVCPRSFSEKSSLTKHIRTHTGEKPYKCEVCHRSFSEKGSLTKHIRIHTGDKPFKCECRFCKL